MISIALGLAQFAPQIARWFAGDKAGDVAQQVVSVAENITGQTGQAAVDALRNNPELAAQFNMRIAELDAQIEQMYLADRQNARAREIELAKISIENNKGRDNTVRNLAYIITFGFLATVFLAPYMPVDGHERDIVMLLTGVLGSKFGDIIAYFFGSSRGSNDKNKLFGKLK